MLEDWERLQAAVGRASELEPAEAGRALAEALGDDPDLLEQARRILESGRREDDFLEPPQPREGAPASALREGVKIGSFKIREVLGHGGMGSVFLAEQDLPSRTVALKVLSSALLAPSALARFRYEVQALASLQHRGIAQIYETGIHTVDDGPLLRELPWFAMEHVAGAQTLIGYADAHALDTEARLRLFLEVCDAVQYGHQKGIVHRDLKPDNLLVGEDGRPKVIDFGVARASDRERVLTTLRTGVGEIVGTLPYMSPEQILGKDGGADVRSDVYALGVVLYELLTGSLPIDVAASDFVTSARRICEHDPVRPSVRVPSLRGDLEAILLKALEKEPAQRYASTNGLAADVRRYLERRPIEARPLNALYQIRKFASRHRTIVAAIAAVVAVSVIGAAVSIGYAVKSHRAEKEAVAQKDKAVEEQERAETLFDTLLQRSFTSTWELAPVIHRLAGGKEPVRKLMASVQADLEVLRGLSQDDPRVRLVLADTYMRLGDVLGSPILANVGDWSGARESYSQAGAIARSVLDEDPSSVRARYLALRSRFATVNVVEPGKYGTLPERIPDFEKVVEGMQALAIDHPTFEPVRGGLTRLHARLAECQSRAGNADKALHHAAAALGTAEAAGEERLLLLAHTAYADALNFSRKPAEALPHLRYVLDAIRPGATAEGANYAQRRTLAWQLYQYGDAARNAAQWPLAIDSLEEGISLFEALGREDPDDRQVYIHHQMALSHLARTYRQHAEVPGLDDETRHAQLRLAIATLERTIRALEARGASPRQATRVAGVRKWIADLEKLLAETK